MSDVLEKFTNHSKKALEKAVDLAFDSGAKLVKPEHLLYGLLEEKGSISSELLQKANLDSVTLKNLLIKDKSGKKTVLAAQDYGGKPISFSLGLKKLIKKTVQTAFLYKHQYVGTEHLLAALIQTADEKMKKIFAQFEIDGKKLEQQLIVVLKSTSKFPDLTDTFQNLKDQHAEEAGNEGVLEYFATELTGAEHQEKLSPVFCREDEIQRIIEILLRKTKNNPILLGDPGVGKTAIVEGLAKRIYEEKVPELLKGKKIVALDLSAVVAGSMYRGDFENRVKQIIDEVTQDPDTILFIDEIHTLIGAGAAVGSMDAANILKPALARGEIRCIGATTYDDYRKNIEKDQAFARRLQPVLVKEPSADQTLEILRGVRPAYEQYHRVKISDEALSASVALSQRFLTDRFFPDKALDLIDEAAAGLKLKKGATPLQGRVRRAKAELANISSGKRQAILDEKFEQAAELKKKEDLLFQQIEQLNKKISGEKINSDSVIRASEISSVVSRVTGIPASELDMEEKGNLLSLEERLSARIVGQTEAIKAVSDSIRLARLGLNREDKPFGSFIFLGPSGVGKTELAKAMAEVIFKDTKALIRLDMSEYGEKFNVSKLIGAPAGYVGHEESGLLTEAVRRRPYSVVLLDEFEKAHPDIFNLLLQVLDTGYLTDATGRRINFRNTIIILTSNIGSESLINRGAMGFGSALSGTIEPAMSAGDWRSFKEQSLKSLKETLRPELLNRFDKVIPFNPLTTEQIDKIFDLKIKELELRLKARQVQLDVTPSARQFILSFEADPAIGARLIERNLRGLVENELANLILRKSVSEADGRTVKITLKDKKIVLE